MLTILPFFQQPNQELCQPALRSFGRCRAFQAHVTRFLDLSQGILSRRRRQRRAVRGRQGGRTRTEGASGEGSCYAGARSTEARPNRRRRRAMIPASYFASVSSRRFVTPASFYFCSAVSFRETVELHIKQAASCSVQYILSNDASLSTHLLKCRKMLESIDKMSSTSPAPLPVPGPYDSFPY
jgi:hypothetical protein